jgi:hypothetical protein
MRFIVELSVDVPSKDSTFEIQDLYFQKDTGTLTILTQVHEKNINKEKNSACTKEAWFSVECQQGLIKSKQHFIVKNDDELHLMRSKLPSESRFYAEKRHVAHEHIEMRSLHYPEVSRNQNETNSKDAAHTETPSLIEKYTGLSRNTLFAVSAVASIAVVGAGVAMTMAKRW